MRELSEVEKKNYRRLRNAFRRALVSQNSRETARSVVLQVLAHAIEIGWIEAPRTLNLDVTKDMKIEVRK